MESLSHVYNDRIHTQITSKRSNGWQVVRGEVVMSGGTKRVSFLRCVRNGSAWLHTVWLYIYTYVCVCVCWCDDHRENTSACVTWWLSSSYTRDTHTHTHTHDAYFSLCTAQCMYECVYVYV